VRDWRSRFDAFVARKTQAAAAARIPGYLQEAWGDTSDLESFGSEWTTRLFDGPFFESPIPAEGLPALNAVFVQSADGNTGARTPSDLGGGETDMHLIYEGLSRVRAGAVLAGAATIRDSQMILSVWHPELVRLRESFGLPRHPAQVVGTRTGRLGIESALMFNVPDIPVFILTTADGAETLKPRVDARPWITILAEPEAPLVAGLRRLRADYGVRRISCIGGRSLATGLLDAGVVQDIYLTTSARPGGDAETPLYAGTTPLHPIRVLKKSGRDEEAGIVFEHLRARAQASAPPLASEPRSGRSGHSAGWRPAGVVRRQGPNTRCRRHSARRRRSPTKARAAGSCGR
jgi:riboflavin biosynthesis pyrimidine reductase